MSQKSQIRTYCPTESAVFLRTRESFGGLSNMAPRFPITINGEEIRTSEALYQVCRFPHKPDVQRVIVDARSPMTAKMKSKKFRQETRPDWDSIRVKIMRWCLRIKLAQNWQTFGSLLLSTSGQDIVEQSRKDGFWGAKPTEDGMLVGMNILGRLLMELREQLMEGYAEDPNFASPPNIPDFLLFSKPIGVDYAVAPRAHPPLPNEADSSFHSLWTSKASLR